MFVWALYEKEMRGHVLINTYQFSTWWTRYVSPYFFYCLFERYMRIVLSGLQYDGNPIFKKYLNKMIFLNENLKKFGPKKYLIFWYIELFKYFTPCRTAFNQQGVRHPWPGWLLSFFNPQQPAFPFYDDVEDSATTYSNWDRDTTIWDLRITNALAVSRFGQCRLLLLELINT